MRVGRHYRIGSFRLDSVERRLTCRGRAVTLRGKAFELLELLAAHAGHIVDKRMLLDSLWPGVSVHDNNIAVTVRSLRKAFEQHEPGVEYVETLPGRGYRLTHAALPLAGGASMDGEGRSLHALEARDEGDACCEDPFVAREAELDRLAALWARARCGSGQVVFISGEPGIGKSRLVRRFSELAFAEAPLALVLEGQCIELLGAAEAHGPFFEALRRGLSGSARSDLLEALELYAPAWFARLPPGLRGSSANPDLDPHAGWHEPRVAPHELVDALGVVSAGRPLLLVLEDVHWADASSVDDLRLLCARAASHALLVVCTYRPHDVRRQNHPLGALLDELTGQERRLELALQAWDAAHLRRYLEQRFGADLPSEELARRIAERSEGLPLFAVRLAQSLVERGLLRPGDSGRWELTLPIEQLDLSATASVTAVIHGHLARLGPTERHTLEAASIDGMEFGTALLSELLDRAAVDVEADLDRAAIARGVIERLGEHELEGGLLDVRYRFRHVLYQNHLYGALGSHRLLELHRRVARVLLASAGAIAPSRLAFHLERGRDYPGAVRYWTEAGDLADRAYAKREALECYGRAALLVERLPEGERVQRQLVLEHGRGWANLGLAQMDAARDHFLAFARLSQQLEATPEPEREAALALAREYFERPWFEPVLQRPAGIFPRGGSRETLLELQAEALTCCCHAANEAAQDDALLEHARDLRALAETGRSEPRRAEALFWLGSHAISAGLADAARAYLDEAISVARQLDHGRALHHALGSRAWLDLMQGALERARQGYEEVLTRVPDAISAARALDAVAEAHAKLGQPAAALGSYARADHLRQRIEPSFPSLHGWLARELGQLALARQLDEAARARLGATEQRPQLSRVLASLASTACRQGEVSRARAELDAAEALVPAGHRSCSWRMRAIWSARCELGASEADVGALEQVAERWRRSALERGDAEGASVACRWLAHGHAARGDHERASELIGGALAATRTTPMPLIDWRSHALCSRIERRRGNSDAAEAARLEACRLVDAIARQLEGPDRMRLEQLRESEL